MRSQSSASARGSQVKRLEEETHQKFRSVEDIRSDNDSTFLNQGKDSENSSWILETDLHSNSLRFSFYMRDIKKIPRNHLRLVQWRAFLVRRSKRWPGLRDPRQQLDMVEFLPGIQYSHYYAQEETDTGIMMETMVPTKDIKEGVNEFLEDGCLRVRILWRLNQQLFQSTYHQYDEIYRFQREQMVQDIHNQTDSSVFSSNNNIFYGNLDDDDDNHFHIPETSFPPKHFRGRRVSSLGDEVYYEKEQIYTACIQHQQSLEGYQLDKKKTDRIREKQASMPGWTGLTPPVKLGQSPPASRPGSTSSRLGGSLSRLGGSLSKLSGSSTRLCSSPKLNTIQMGLAAILKPENYMQQQNRIMPFIPGACSTWLSKSQDEGLSNPDIQLENTLSIPPNREVSSAEDLMKTGSTRRARPRKLLGIYKCQSFNC